MMLTGGEDVAGALDHGAQLAERLTHVSNNRHLVGIVGRPVGDVEKRCLEWPDAIEDRTEKRGNAQGIGQRKLIAK